MLSYLIKREEKNNKSKQAKKAKWYYALSENKAAKVNFSRKVKFMLDKNCHLMYFMLFYNKQKPLICFLRLAALAWRGFRALTITNWLRTITNWP